MVTFRSIVLLAACILLTPFSAIATETLGAGEAAEVALAATAEFVLPANTVIELEMVEPVGSKTSKPGDLFHLRVATAVELKGSVVIAAGTPAVGQVVHATRSGTGGKAGELILAARYLDMPHGKVKLRMVVVTGVFGMLVRGRDVELPAGSPLSARLAIDTIFPQARPEPANAAP
jgi:hypothetical protein